MRIKFCGCIQGTVEVRKGETYHEARLRVEETLNDLMARQAKRLGDPDNGDNCKGPVVGIDFGAYDDEEKE